MNWNPIDWAKGQQQGTTNELKKLNQQTQSKTGRARAASQNPYSSQYKGSPMSGGSVASGTANALLYQGADVAAQAIAPMAVRGAAVVLGADMKNYDRRAKGLKPLQVKSVGSTDFNVATPEGKAAYEKALKNVGPKVLPSSSIEELRKRSDQERAKYPAPVVDDPALAPTSPPVTPPDTPTGRDTAPPSDPNNTGAKGTAMGLSGGSIATPFDGKAFEAMLGNYGIQMANPFDSNVQPGTLGGDNQRRLAPGEIKGAFNEDGQLNPGYTRETLIDGQDVTENLYVDTNKPQEQGIVSKGEADRTLDSSDSEELEIGVDGYYGGGLSDRSRAFLDYDGPGGSMMALRAANASQGIAKQGGQAFAVDAEGNYQKITDEGYEMRKSGKIDAQTLLDEHLAQVPGKVVDKAVNEGDADVVTEPGAAEVPTLTETVIDGSDMSSTTYTGEEEIDEFFANTRKNIQGNAASTPPSTPDTPAVDLGSRDTPLNQRYTLTPEEVDEGLKNGTLDQMQSQLMSL